MTRIIGGVAGGRRLKTPPGEGTRPTSDRVREALFSALEAQSGTLVGHRLLDLYAGSGAVALEALSRGAASATAVESERSAARVIQANAAALGLALTVLARPVERVVVEPCAVPFDVIFLDPPYAVGEDALAEVLRQIAAHGWAGDGALIVIERSSRSPEPVYPQGWEPLRMKRYGETVLWYVRMRDVESEESRDDATGPNMEGGR